MAHRTRVSAPDTGARYGNRRRVTHIGRGHAHGGCSGIRSRERKGVPTDRAGFGGGPIAGIVSGWLACWVPPRTIFAAEAPSTAERLSVLEPNESVKNVANIKSQIKRIGTNKKAQERNKAVKSEFKSAIRATRTAIAAGDKDKAVVGLAFASKKLDKAVSKGVIHQNQAANKKSAIAKAVGALV